MQRNWHVTADTIKRWVMSRRWLMAPTHLSALLNTSDTSGSIQPAADTGIASGTQAGETVHTLPDYLDSLWFKGIRVNAAGVATFPLHGAMYHRDCGLTWVLSAAFGGHITEKSLPLLEKVAALPEVKAVVIDVDSPGGEASGCVEFAATIARINAMKPVVSYVSGYMASAAYFSACPGRKIMAAADGWAGSIGAVIHFYSDSRMLKNMGIDEFTFISEQSPDKWPDPASESGAAIIQGEVDTCAAKFIETVAAYRGISTEEVLANYGQGRIFIAGEAQARGMIDAIGDRVALDALVASLVPEPEQTPAPLTPPAAESRPAPLRDAVKRRLQQLRPDGRAFDSPFRNSEKTP